MGWVVVVVVSASSHVRRAVTLSVGLASWDVRASASAMNFSRGSARSGRRCGGHARHHVRASARFSRRVCRSYIFPLLRLLMFSSTVDSAVARTHFHPMQATPSSRTHARIIFIRHRLYSPAPRSFSKFFFLCCFCIIHSIRLFDARFGMRRLGFLAMNF